MMVMEKIRQILLKVKEKLGRLFTRRHKGEPGAASPACPASPKTPKSAAVPCEAPDAPPPTPVQAIVADEKVDQLIEAMDAPRQQFEILLREFAALPEKADKLIAAGQSQTEAADRIREAVAGLGTKTEEGLAAVSEHAERQMELAAGIRDGVRELREQNEQGLGALGKRAEQQAGLLVKIEQALEAAREPQAKMLAAIEGMSGKIEDTSRSSAAQAEEVRQMGQSVTKATGDLSESMKAGSRRVTMLLMGILAALVLLVVAVVAGIFVGR